MTTPDLTLDLLANLLHRAVSWQYGECDHGTYSGGPSDGSPYEMCLIWAGYIWDRLPRPCICGHPREQHRAEVGECLSCEKAAIGKPPFPYCERYEQSSLLAEVERLRRWKAEAVPVMDGLQDLGKALDLPLGERITGPAALAEVERLKAENMRLMELVEQVRLGRWDARDRVILERAHELLRAVEAQEESEC